MLPCNLVAIAERKRGGQLCRVRHGRTQQMCPVQARSDHAEAAQSSGRVTGIQIGPSSDDCADGRQGRRDEAMSQAASRRSAASGARLPRRSSRARCRPTCWTAASPCAPPGRTPRSTTSRSARCSPTPPYAATAPSNQASSATTATPSRATAAAPPSPPRRPGCASPSCRSSLAEPSHPCPARWSRCGRPTNWTSPRRAARRLPTLSVRARA